MQFRHSHCVSVARNHGIQNCVSSVHREPKNVTTNVHRITLDVCVCCRKQLPVYYRRVLLDSLLFLTRFCPPTKAVVNVPRFHIIIAITLHIAQNIAVQMSERMVESYAERENTENEL